jgi:hypothetical protein
MEYTKGRFQPAFGMHKGFLMKPLKPAGKQGDKASRKNTGLPLITIITGSLAITYLHKLPFYVAKIN